MPIAIGFVNDMRTRLASTERDRFAHRKRTRPSHARRGESCGSSWYERTVRLLPARRSALGLLVLGFLAPGCRPHSRPTPDGEAQALASSAAHTLSTGEARTPTEDDCGLPRELRARGWPTMLPNLRPGAPPPALPGGFSLLVLPDTQYYVACRSPHLARQVEYALEHQAEQNIALVLTVGDLTDHNDDAEWSFFHEAVAPLFDRVPLILTTGNHDHGVAGSSLRRGSGLVRTFGQPPARSRALLAEVPPDGDWENAYYRLPIGKTTLGILSLEWSPRASMVDWAGSVLDRHPTDRIVFTTHAYLYHDDTRYDWERYGQAQEWNPRAYGTARLDPALESGPGNWAPEGAYDGEMLWRGLLASRPALWLTLNGHVLMDGQGYLPSRGEAGNLVHQMLVNFQMLAEGGSGFLRLLQIDPSGRSMRVFTYSPSLGQLATGSTEQFEVQLDPPLALK